MNERYATTGEGTHSLWHHIKWLIETGPCFTGGAANGGYGIGCGGANVAPGFSAERDCLGACRKTSTFVSKIYALAALSDIYLSFRFSDMFSRRQETYSDRLLEACRKTTVFVFEMYTMIAGLNICSSALGLYFREDTRPFPTSS